MARGQEVLTWVQAFLDQTFPLDRGSHAEVSHYGLQAGQLITDRGRLRNPWQFAGYSGNTDARWCVLLRNHGLHVELRIDPDHHPMGRHHPAGVADVVLESAASAIMDFDDSVAVADANDKISIYRNWLGLMTGGLGAKIDGADRMIRGRPSPDRTYIGSDGAPLVLKGRSLMLAGNVGMRTHTPLVRLNGQQVPEGVIDCLVTALIAMHDVQGSRRNSALGSIYIVKPKLHGPSEAAFTARLFDAVEDLLQLDRHTIKIGLMDEARRTSLNLMAVIAPLRRRVVFINTDVFGRTSDEVQTAMALGPVRRRSEMKDAAWLRAYEDNNVQVGLACGFAGRAQIGKGMWRWPDHMAAMMEHKLAQPSSGANTAWVQSPVAATLHALHYHQVDVAARQLGLADRCADRGSLFVPPTAGSSRLNDADIAAERDSNIQSILGYVSRWVGQGAGYSKVPDPKGVGLLEDRASCRVSSQILANWLRHGVLTVEAVTEALDRIARTVDELNEADVAYVRMGDDFKSSHAFQASRALILRGPNEPGGFTERVLRSARLRQKTSAH
jgi:malate synthase